MGQHRALYQIGGISPGHKNDFTTARPLAKARDFRSGSKATFEGPVVAQSGHSPKQMELQTTSRASWNTVNRGIDVNRCGVPMPIGELSY
jgi:hypothetical protein